MIRWIRRRGPVLLAAALLLWATPDGVAGQSLHLAELFAEQGRLDDARAEVLAWFEIRGAEATPVEMQHGLWLRGRFAPSPAEGLRDLEDLVTRYPEGPFTDRALAWMAAWAADRTDTPRAVELYTRLLTDFPESDRAPAARDWLRGRGIPVPEVAREPAPATPAVVATVPAADTVPVPEATLPPADTATAVAEVAVDTVPVPEAAPPPADTAAVVTEVTPDTVPMPEAAAPPADTAVAAPVVADTAAVTPVPPAADSAAAEPEPTPEPRPAPPPVERIPHGPPVPGAADGGRWAVQIGAFRNPDGAAGLVREMVEAGLEARLVQVPLNDLLRVRVGRFATSEEAMAELERVRTAGWDGAVVADAREETVVRR